MTDLPVPSSTLSVEDRLALIETRIGIAAPLALVPPIVVGSLANVPTPGSQIAAQWAQDVSALVIHRFATKAGIDAWVAPAGSRAVQVDTGIEWRRIGGVWSQVTPWTLTTVGIGSLALPVGWSTVNTLNIPADPGPRVAHLSCFLRADLYQSEEHYVILTADGVTQCEAFYAHLSGGTFDGTTLAQNVSLSCEFALPTNRVIAVDVRVWSANTISVSGVYGTLARNRLDALVVPR